MTYTRTRERAVTVVTVCESVTETYTSDDPTPRRPALRVVTTDGHTIEESVRPLAKCRQVTPIRSLKRKAIG